jgi:hypothetical protein
MAMTSADASAALCTFAGVAFVHPCVLSVIVSVKFPLPSVVTDAVRWSPGLTVPGRFTGYFGYISYTLVLRRRAGAARDRLPDVKAVTMSLPRLVFLMMLLVVIGAAAGPPARSASLATKQTVMTFDLGWAPTPHMPWADLTQAVLFALQTKKGPGLDASQLAGVNVGSWVSAAHAHQVQAMITIGGSDDQTWQFACNTTNRAKFVSNLVHYTVNHGFDGIDIDIEDDLWASKGPPSAGQTTCARAIAKAAHAARSHAGKPLWVSEDVITNWQGSWIAPYASQIDQFNLMTYGDKLSKLGSDVQATHRQGLPYSKMVIGVDVDDYAEPTGGCLPYATYAKQKGLNGAFVWDASSDWHKGANACLNALAGAG